MSELDQEIERDEEQQQASQEVAQEQNQPEREDESVVNWKKANEVLKFQKMRIDELEQQIAQRPQTALAVEEKDEFDDLDQQDYLTVEQARKMAGKMAEKKAKVAVRQELEEYDRQQRIANDEQRCTAKYEDYDYVMQNYALPMIKNDPALAYKIQQSKNPAETAYRLGKLSDSYEDTMTKSNTPSPKAEKVLKNSQRPVSSNASGNLKSQADHYSKMSKDEVWTESQKYARQA